MAQNTDKHGEHHAHHVLPPRIIIMVWVFLLIGTALTVGASRFHFGALNYLIGMVIATAKALLVVLFFMGMKYDNVENRVIFGVGFVFFGIFIFLTISDLFFRQPPQFDAARFAKAAEARAASQFADPWVPTKDLIARGKGIFAAQCVACHGATGEGNGPAAAALNPPPRDFTKAENWKNGRKPSQIFKTLSNGLNNMPSFATSPAPDRWALAHYVATLGPGGALKDTPEDLKAAGVDTSGKGGAAAEKTIPVELAIEIMAEEAKKKQR